LASTLAVTHWFDRRRGMALGILATSTRVLMSLIPVLLNLAIELYSWRIAWILSAVFVWIIVIPIARRGLIDKPSDVGQVVDGAPMTAAGDHKPAPPLVITRAQAVRTSRFWIVAAYGSTTGFMSTALNFHQISMLGEAGMSATEAAVMFLPQVIGAAAAGIVFGYFADRLTGRILIPMVMGLMAAGLLLVQFLAPGLTTIVYSVSLGATMGAGRTVTSTLLPRWFGLVHIGSIQSTIGLIGVASTAFGPVAFALVTDLTGSYASAAAWFAIVPVVVALVASLMRSLPAGSGRKISV
jgi:MFS family permease